MTDSTALRQRVGREAILSAGINAAISLAFFVAVFGSSPSIAVRGIGNLAFDFLPQSFAIGFMASLVPGLLNRRKIAGARADRPVLPVSLRGVVIRSMRNALFALVPGGALGTVLYVSGLGMVDATAALFVKVLYGGLLGAFVTRIMLLELARGNEGKTHI